MSVEPALERATEMGLAVDANLADERVAALATNEPRPLLIGGEPTLERVTE